MDCEVIPSDEHLQHHELAIAIYLYLVSIFSVPKNIIIIIFTNNNNSNNIIIIDISFTSAH